MSRIDQRVEAVPADNPGAVRLSLRSRRDVADRLAAIRSSRLATSNHLDRVLNCAAGFYVSGAIDPRDLRGTIARLESLVRAHMPDLAVHRAPRSASITPRHVALVVSEPAFIENDGFAFVGVESHAVVLRPDGLDFVSGVLPGSTTPHLFDQIVKRRGGLTSLADVLLRMSRLWPTLLSLRSRQRRMGRGVPPRAIVTPYGDGLLFAAVEKLEGMPCSGTSAVSVTRGGGVARRELRDWYAEGDVRLNVETRTFVGRSKLSVRQIEVHDRLVAFEREFEDVIAEGDWRWRIGLGQADAAVQAMAGALRLTMLTRARREAAYDVLEAIVESDAWMREAEVNEANQHRSRLALRERYE